MLNDNITIAIPKGRILTDAAPILAKVGIHLDEQTLSNRKLIHEFQHTGLRVCLTRSKDVLELVQAGYMDMGIVGSDTILNGDSSNIRNMFDLNVSKCRLSFIGKEDSNLFSSKRICVATKYTNITENYFSDVDIEAKIVKMHGSVEMAPMLGMADVALDIVDTGGTIKANGLVDLLTVCPVSAHLILGNKFFAEKAERIIQFVQQLMIARDQHRGQIENLNLLDCFPITSHTFPTLENIKISL